MDIAANTRRSTRVRSAWSATVDEVLKHIQPMDDLSRFVIDDLTPDEEDAFFNLLEDA